MTSAEVVAEIVSIVANSLEFMLPIIGVMAGLMFVITWLMSILGFGNKTFR